MDPLFTVGQRVKRKEDREIVGAEVLEVSSILNMNGTEYIYKIKYDEGPSEGNDGTGFWPENALIAEPALLEEPALPA